MACAQPPIVRPPARRGPTGVGRRQAGGRTGVGAPTEVVLIVPMRMPVHARFTSILARVDRSVADRSGAVAAGEDARSQRLTVLRMADTLARPGGNLD